MSSNQPDVKAIINRFEYNFVININTEVSYYVTQCCGIRCVGSKGIILGGDATHLINALERYKREYGHFPSMYQKDGSVLKEESYVYATYKDGTQVTDVSGIPQLLKNLVWRTYEGSKSYLEWISLSYNVPNYGQDYIWLWFGTSDETLEQHIPDWKNVYNYKHHRRPDGTTVTILWRNV